MRLRHLRTLLLATLATGALVAACARTRVDDTVGPRLGQSTASAGSDPTRPPPDAPNPGVSVPVSPALIGAQAPAQAPAQPANGAPEVGGAAALPPDGGGPGVFSPGPTTPDAF